jgi:hypothetical protein
VGRVQEWSTNSQSVSVQWLYRLFFPLGCSEFLIVYKATVNQSVYKKKRGEKKKSGDAWTIDGAGFKSTRMLTFMD